MGAADDAVALLYDRVYRELVSTLSKGESAFEACTHALWVAHNLERIAGRATNIAERAVYTTTGMFPTWTYLGTSRSHCVPRSPSRVL